MLKIKTTVKKYEGVSVEDYINVPVIDRVTSYIDFTGGTIYGNNQSKAIGVITFAEDIGNGDIELTIALWRNKLQGEFFRCADGKVTPMSYSIGLEKE